MKNMMISALLIMAAVLSACGPTPAPTMSPLDVQNTAVAAAWTVVALTQQSIPTATPLPPTDTPTIPPPPTLTPLPLPTLDLNAQPTQAFGFPTAGSNSGGPTADPCNQPMAANAAGHKTTVHFENASNGSVIMSLYMTKVSVFGECGFYTFNLSKTDSPTVQILQGCYWAGAYINGKQASKAFGNFCVTSPNTKYTVRITSEVISLIQ